MATFEPNAEWLEADGLGGFASGTADLVRTRRYHALLLAATTPPTGRMVLVNGCEVHAQTPAGAFALSAQRYQPDVVHPDGQRRIAAFAADPWPTWTFALEDGTRIVHEVFVPRDAACVALSWRLAEPRPGVTLRVRPLLSGRDYHALHHENGAARSSAQEVGERVRWQPYADVPAVVARSNGSYRHGPLWYRGFLYTEERARGLDAVEDLLAPGELTFDLSAREALLLLATESAPTSATSAALTDAVAAMRAAELARREAFPTRLHRAAADYVVRRGEGRTVIAGYPWFTDWGRDTFIALRGLCLATGQLAQARSVLLEWAGAVDRGMLPNRFPDRGGAPEFNSVDSSLWYAIAVHDYLQAARDVRVGDRAALARAVTAIVSGHAAGTRHGIRADADGLLAAGESGVQLTWMDAKVGDWVVTPRIGKPVEIQALWLNALRIAAQFDRRWEAMFERGRASFAQRFWNEARGCLFDVVDAGHVPGAVEDALRPNQIFAIGGLPFAILDGDRARRVVDLVEQRLWTPLGLRSLAPGDPGYAGRYAGDPLARDGAYHQGTVWPWLIGAFVEAWLRTHGDSARNRTLARKRFLDPLLAHLQEAGLGHVSEVADGDAPHRPGGCPFQAWSVGEVLRLQTTVLAPRTRAPARKVARTGTQR
jgi:predicted glycogen debranching enzyme